MFVNAHAVDRIYRRLAVRGGGKTLTAAIVARLEAVPGELGSVAVEVHRFLEPQSDGQGSNGDQLVVIARDGTVETVMLRRSWNQPFTRDALHVDRIVSLA